MLAKVCSGAVVGLDAVPVTVEVDITHQGLPSFTLVGLGDRAVDEAKERVRSALKNSGAEFPAKKIIINLAPADLPKEGPSFDLSIALGLLVASGQLSADLSKTLCIGELSLDGSLRPVSGSLIYALMAKDLGLSRLFLPKENAQEAALVEGVDIIPLNNITEAFKFLSGNLLISPAPPSDLSFEELNLEYDFKEIKGQEQARRALEIAATGGHNVLLKGPPGAGKTLLARSFPSIMPKMTKDEALEVTKIHSISGTLKQGLIAIRPFRSPHHSASYVGLIGGGNSIKPGEITLAHRGVLFLDELPEFPRMVLESLRQPLEDKKVTISRASGTISYPAKFILIAACNPCPCGFLGSPNKNCSCLPGTIARYKKRLSGPLLDRIDIHLDVPAVEVEKLTNHQTIEDSATIRSRVEQARQIQLQRFAGSGILTNSEMTNPQIKEYCQMTAEALELLKLAISQMNLSARSYHRVLKLSRTIADLNGEEVISDAHVAESLTYRSKEE